VTTAEARARRMQVALTLFPGLYLALGVVFLIQAPVRTSGPAFDVARQVPGGIHAWGFAFLILGFIQALALFSHIRTFTGALVIGSFLVWFWVYVIGRAAFNSPEVSWSSVVWIGGIGVLHWIVAYLIPRSDVSRPRA
jgi:hypothetical protein